MLDGEKMRKNKVIVSERAILQRINRVLSKEGEMLKKSRPAYQTEIGDFYLIDLERNFVIKKDVDIEALARKKGVLAGWETLEKRD
jgi:hypothetical protein